MAGVPSLTRRNSAITSNITELLFFLPMQFYEYFYIMHNSSMTKYIIQTHKQKPLNGVFVVILRHAEHALSSGKLFRKRSTRILNPSDNGRKLKGSRFFHDIYYFDFPYR